MTAFQSWWRGSIRLSPAQPPPLKLQVLVSRRFLQNGFYWFGIYGSLWPQSLVKEHSLWSRDRYRSLAGSIPAKKRKPTELFKQGVWHSLAIDDNKTAECVHLNYICTREQCVTLTALRYPFVDRVCNPYIIKNLESDTDVVIAQF